MAGDQRIVARDGETEDIIILNARHFVFLFFFLLFLRIVHVCTSAYAQFIGKMGISLA